MNVHQIADYMRIETLNIVNRKDGGYEHVYEFIAIGTPNAATIAKISSIRPAEEIGDRTLCRHSSRSRTHSAIY